MDKSKTRKEKEKELPNKLDVLTDSLIKNVQINNEFTQAFSKSWEEMLKKYKHNELHQNIVSYHRSITMQMTFKDDLIEKLQNWFDETDEHRNRIGRKNLELVNNVLNWFKEQIQQIHNQYQFKIETTLPKNMDEVQVRINDNDDKWKILKYYSDVVQMQLQKMNSRIKNQNFEDVTSESGRFQAIIGKINWKDKLYLNTMMNNYNFVLDQYKIKTDEPMKNFMELKKENENLLVEKTILNNRIKELLSTINQLNKETNEPESSKELRTLVEKMNESKNNLMNYIIKVKNNFKLSQKKISFLCQITEDIKEEINNELKKGEGIMRRIKLCQKIESSIGKINLFPTRDELDNMEQIEQHSDLGENMSTFWNRLSYIKHNSELLNEKNNRLQLENIKFKEEIRILRFRCKQ